MRVYCITTDCPATKGINTRHVVLVKSLPPDLKYSPVDIINSLVNNVLRGHNPLAKLSLSVDIVYQFFNENHGANCDQTTIKLIIEVRLNGRLIIVPWHSSFL